MYLVSKWPLTKEMLQNVTSKSLYSSHNMENLTKPLKTGVCSCMRTKGKVVAVHVMKVYGAVEVLLHSFYTSALAGGKWSASSHGRFTLKREPSVHTEYVGLGGPNPVRTFQKMRKISRSCRRGNARIVHPIAQC
jgi:hypothetical protein